jgi:hypothetical protein
MTRGREDTTHDKSDGNDSDDSPQRGRRGRRGSPPVAEVVRRVREDLTALLGRPVEAVLGVQRDDDGWVVRAQVTELSRIPPTTDVLGEYEVTTDEQGELLGYRRRRRYHRNQVDED